MNRGIVFDLDGTLWDSSEQVVPAWNAVFARHTDIRCQITVSDMRAMMGKTVADIAGILLPDAAEAFRLQIMRECCAEEQNYLRAHGGTLFPELEKTLSALKQNHFLCIVSNCQDGYIESFLDFHRLWPYFSDTECQGRTGQGKGENIRAVVQRNHLDRAVYVGDTQGDLDAADAAEIPFIHAAYGFGRVDRPTAFIQSFSELPRAVEELL